MAETIAKKEEEPVRNFKKQKIVSNEKKVEE